MARSKAGTATSLARPESKAGTYGQKIWRWTISSSHRGASSFWTKMSSPPCASRRKRRLPRVLRWLNYNGWPHDARGRLLKVKLGGSVKNDERGTMNDE